MEEGGFDEQSKVCSVSCRLKCLRHYGGLSLRYSPPAAAASRPRGIEIQIEEIWSQGVRMMTGGTSKKCSDTGIWGFLGFRGVVKVRGDGG